MFNLMKLGVLFSGGKDSCYAGFLAKKHNHKLACLISIFSKNKSSYMFHTPNIEQTQRQAEVMNIPLIIKETEGEKEKELGDLEKAIKLAIKKYKIQGIVTGAIKSNYQASRIQSICNKLDIECFNPLWQKNELEYLRELIKYKFKIILVGVFAYPLDKNYLGKEIDKKFIEDFLKLNKKYQISMIGEGGEFETFVLDCPLFKRKLIVKNKEIYGMGNSWNLDLQIEKKKKKKKKK